ncbi:IclR family transcriptional regulator domain-containing protein [Streptomyces sp. NBC_00069]|uniref:IclR family transcriptional regulator domain-containing protein n=1 Tax=Streptomyces sp. NBC_00069 TaxID=2975639 RepID=UPI003D80A68B
MAGEHHPGPRLKLTTTPGREHELVKVTLDDLCRRLGAAVYYSRYTDGEVAIVTSASGPKAPPAVEGVPFPHVAHASAVGNSLLTQLDFAGRMDHLARYKPRALTGRTITDPRRLFAELDVHGPQAGQFDLLEYSDREVCAAFPLTMPGRAGPQASPCPCPPTSTPAPGDRPHPQPELRRHPPGTPPRRHRRHQPHQPTRHNQAKPLASREHSRPRPALTNRPRHADTPPAHRTRARPSLSDLAEQYGSRPRERGKGRDRLHRST